MSEPRDARPPVRIANCSGFLGDRLDAAAQMVRDGSIDVLTGDWLAELTMLILARQRMKHGAGTGYARTFLQQMEQVLGTCIDRGIRVVTNAGGLDPQGLADELQALAQRLGVPVRIGVVTGDDLMPRLEELRAAGEGFVNLDTGERLDDLGIVPITANAYLGARGIVSALAQGADVVITGRVTDAALAIGPAAWWHNWPLLQICTSAPVTGADVQIGAPEPPFCASAPVTGADVQIRGLKGGIYGSAPVTGADEQGVGVDEQGVGVDEQGVGVDEQGGLDALAGALVAGHVIECGAQATGGNYSFFADVPGMLQGQLPGLPIAEIAADGTSIITKHPDTPGMVTVGTVTAQLLYELGPNEYVNPDVIARFDTIDLAQVGRDRVRISKVTGLPGPTRLKVAMNYLGGFRNTMTLVITGLDAPAKAEVACRAICGVDLAQVGEFDSRTLAVHSCLDVDELSIDFAPSGHVDPARPAQAQSFLHITVKATDPKRIAKAFTSAVIEPVLSSYPGYFPTTPPAEPTPFGVYWPTTVAAANVVEQVRMQRTQP